MNILKPIPNATTVTCNGSIHYFPITAAKFPEKSAEKVFNEFGLHREDFQRVLKNFITSNKTMTWCV